MGAAAAGSAAVTGSGAIDTISAQRGLAVDVAGDQGAYVGILPNTGSDFVNYDDGTVSLDFGFNSENGGSGVNKAGYTEARPAFSLRNQADETMYVGIRNALHNDDISTTQSIQSGFSGASEVPAGFDFQFIVANDVPHVNTDGVGMIDRADAPSNFGGNFGASYDPTKVSADGGGMNAYRSITSDDQCGYVELGPGKEVPVIARSVVTPNFDLEESSVPDVDFQVEAVDEESSARLDDNLTENLNLGLSNST